MSSHKLMIIARQQPKITINEDQSKKSKMTTKVFLPQLKPKKSLRHF